MTQNPDQPLRIILAGVGQRGIQWAQVANEIPDCQVVAYVEPNDAYRARVKERFDVPDEAIFVDYDQALDNVETDAIVLATPPMGRVEQCKRAIDLGYPILSEKPLTMTFEETVDVTLYARDHNVPLVAGFNFRHLKVTQATKRILDSGELGDASFARVYLYWHRMGDRPGGNRYPLVMDHPMLLEQSVHALDLIRYVYSSDVKSLTARTHNPPWSPYAGDATATALLEMENGMLVNYLGTWMMQSLVREYDWRTDCSGGAIFQRSMFGDLYVAKAGSAELEPVELGDEKPFIDDTRGLLEDFVRGVKAGGESLASSGIDNLKTMALTCACIESSQASGERIEMADYCARFGLTPDDVNT
jgi:predicted dehydrogenase